MCSVLVLSNLHDVPKTTSIPLGSIGCLDLAGLTSLDLSENDIVNVPGLGSDSGGLGLTSLHHLQLQGNSIKELGVSTFAGMESLVRHATLAQLAASMFNKQSVCV